MKPFAFPLALSLLTLASVAGAQDPDVKPLPPFESTTGTEPPTAEPAPTESSEADRVGLSLALRTGYMLPAGSASGVAGDDMSRTFGGQVPVAADLGYKPIPAVFVGAYGAFAFGGAGGQLDTTCTRNGVDCSTHSLHLGVEVLGHLRPLAKVDPWLGYGIGFETMHVDETVPTASQSYTFSGIELAHVMAGVDFHVAPMVAVGPVLDVSIAKYSHASASGPIANGDVDIQNTALHEWLSLGARVVFGS